MTPWEQAVSDVAHDAGCGSGATIDMEYGFPHLTRDPCDCTRDARIAKGIAAALLAVYGHTFYGVTDPSYPDEVYDAAAIAAFKEASRG